MSPLPDSSTPITFLTEYARSGRSACNQCREKIANQSVRVAAQFEGPSTYSETKWFHPDCLKSCLEEDKRNGIHREEIIVENLVGWTSLRSPDQEALRKIFPSSSLSLPLSSLSLPTPSLPTPSVPFSIPTLPSLPDYSFTMSSTSVKVSSPSSPVSTMKRKRTQTETLPEDGLLFEWDDDSGEVHVTGNTYPVKEIFREYGGTWNYRNKVKRKRKYSDFLF